MNWYYVDAGQQAGPVDDAQLQELVRIGKIQSDTLVWREGMPNWQTYNETFNPGASQTAAPAPTAAPVTSGDTTEAVCTECNRIFDKRDMIQYGTVHVCASCKPIFMQKLAEGVHIRGRGGKRPLPVNADELLREIDQRDYRVDIGACISRGWELVKSNFWLCVGATFLIIICTQAAGIIPIAGIIASLLLQGPLFGGLFLFFIKQVRGEPVDIGDAFSGFTIGFWRLCGTMVLMSLIIYLPFIPGAIALFMAGGTAGPGGGLEPGIIVAFVLLGIGMLVALYLGVGFFFAMPLAADMRLGVLDSLRVSLRVVIKHWFSIFALLFVCGLLMMLGLIACVIGVFVTMPIFYAASMYAYEDIFGMR